MSVNISVGGFDLSNYGTTASVTTEYIDFGYRWGAVQKGSIQGQFYLGQCADPQSTYQGIVGLQNGLFSAWEKEFQDVSIGGKLLKNCKLDSIDFQESNYLGTVGFSANFTSYGEDYFVATVLDPVNSITYSEQKNKTIQITHKVSARGINTAGDSSNALQNARTYVSARIVATTGLPNINKITGNSIRIMGHTPRKKVETVDRINGTVSAEIVYIIKQGQSADSTLLYSIDCNYDDEKGLSTGTIRGNLTGSIGQDMDALRRDFKQVSLFGLLNSSFKKMGHGALLNQPENMTVNENAREKTIEFSYTCNSIVSPIKTFDKTFSMSCDYVSDKITINFSGRVEFRGGQQQRQTNAQGFTFTPESAFALCSEFYSNNSSVEFGANATINPAPLVFEIKRDLINGIVTINATCDNRRAPDNNNFTTFDYTLSANLSLDNYCALIQFLDGGTSGLKYNMKTRGEISIQGTATAKVSGLSDQCLQMATNKLQELVSAVGLSDEFLIESKVDYTDNPDDSGYIYSVTVSKSGLTEKTTADYGAGAAG